VDDHGDGRLGLAALDAEIVDLRGQVDRLRSENARLLRLLALTPSQARPPGPIQTGLFDAAPGSVHAGSPVQTKVGFFAAMFGARTDAYAVRWENRRSGKAGWMPAVRGGWRRGVPADQREYLPLTEEVVTAHLSGEVDLGLYPSAGRRPVPLAGSRLRRPGGDAGRPGLPQGGPGSGCPGRP
jgi:hypothetical protein